MTAEPPETKPPRRNWHVQRWLVALFLVACSYFGWRAYDSRAAVREAKAKGFVFEMSDDPFDVIRRDWRAAFRKATWTDHQRELRLPRGTDLAPIGELLHRLRPTKLTADACKNVDALRGLTSLEHLVLNNCVSLQNVDDLKGLTGLQTLDLAGCFRLQNVDGIKGLAGLKKLNLPSCVALRNVDPIKELIGLQWLRLEGCTALHSVDALQRLTGLKYLDLNNLPVLQNADAVKGLTGLEKLSLAGCARLQNVDGLKGLSGLQHLWLGSCPALQNVDALKGLTGLLELDLRWDTNIPAPALWDLVAVLPKLRIILPKGVIPPQKIQLFYER